MTQGIGLEQEGRLRPAATGASPPLGVERVFEILVCLLALLLLSPLLVALAALVRLQDGGSILFGHVRIGKDGRRFRCLKFRTMAADAETHLAAMLRKDPRAREEWKRDHKLKIDPRVTPLGRFLRTSSLDELPQLLNVLRGDMSLVGPRPIVAAEIRRYGRYFPTYCSVRPGLTGLWQISGRNDVSYRRRVAMDVLFVRRRSLRIYSYILVATVPAVLLRRGAN